MHTPAELEMLEKWKDAHAADDVDLFMKQRNLPRHPLVDQGYPSIGCWPCTRPASDPLDPRSGRWAGQDKTECGLHLDKTERPQVF